MTRSLLNKYFGNIDKLITIVSAVPRQSLYVGLVLMLFASLLDGVGIGLMIPFLKILLNEGGTIQLPSMPLTQDLNFWLKQQDKGVLITLFAVVQMGALTLKAYLFYASQYLTVLYRESITADLREHLYETYLRAPVSFFDNTQLGRVNHTIMGEVPVANSMMAFFFSALTSILTLVAYLATLLVVSWKLTLLIVLLIGLIGLGLTFLLKSIKESGTVQSTVNHNLSVRVLDTLGGVRVVKSYGAEDFELKNYKKISRSLLQVVIALMKKQSLIDPLTEWATLAAAMVIFVSSYALFISKGILTAAELLTFMLVLIRIIPITKRINGARAFIQEYLPSVANVNKALELQDQYPPFTGTEQFTGLREGIVFHNVRFSYTGKTDVLNGFNLEVPKGKTIALVGSSGAGKSTLAALVPRLYDISSGIIELDGRDIRDYDVTSLRKRIGIVSQDTYVFSTSIRENIAYGLEGISDMEIVEAARLANAHDFICELPNGYDTLVGDRGVQLSGGQRQRISIARAILRDPEILILDEATSALDSQSEYLVQEAIERLRQNRTVIVIAHRLSTIRNADRIVVLDKGQVVEHGDHNELLKNKGAYWSFHNLQVMPTA